LPNRHQVRYEQSEKTDLSRVPVPRYGLLKMRRYAFGTVQVSSMPSSNS
jgi:hypothetical protein